MPKTQAASTKRPVVKLIGADSNAFNILGLCQRAAKQAGWSTEKWAQVRNEMTAGDYDHLLGIAMEHFDVR